MTEDEILIRAREACCHSDYSLPNGYADIRSGASDDYMIMCCVLRALRDLDKPLSEIVPVDPDLIAAREIVAVFWRAANCRLNAEDVRRGECDAAPAVQCALAGIRAGKAMRS